MEHDEEQEPGRPLGSFEELILLALARASAPVTGTWVCHELNKADERFQASSVYTTLNRLERKAYTTSISIPGGKKRGGRRSRGYTITQTGRAALAHAERIRATLRGEKGPHP